MRVIREITIGERKVLIKELTLAEIRAWLANSANPVDIDLVDTIYSADDLLITDIPQFCDLTVEDLVQLAPSEIDPVVQAIREVNARFFATWQRRLAEVRGSPVPTASPASLPA